MSLKNRHFSKAAKRFGYLDCLGITRTRKHRCRFGIADSCQKTLYIHFKLNLKKINKICIFHCPKYFKWKFETWHKILGNMFFQGASPSIYCSFVQMFSYMLFLLGHCIRCIENRLLTLNQVKYNRYIEFIFQLFYLLCWCVNIKWNRVWNKQFMQITTKSRGNSFPRFLILQLEHRVFEQFFSFFLSIKICVKN